MKRKALVIGGVVALAETMMVAVRRGSMFKVETVVRCKAGHLFTTWWIPGAFLKALRFGWWRFQRCPVGHHWTFVTPVKAADLSAGELREAHAVHDARIP